MVFIPRESNLWADWLSKVGADIQGDKDLGDLGVEPEETNSPPKHITSLNAAHHSVIACRVCTREVDGAKMEC